MLEMVDVMKTIKSVLPALETLAYIATVLMCIITRQVYNLGVKTHRNLFGKGKTSDKAEE